MSYPKSDLRQPALISHIFNGHTVMVSLLSNPPRGGWIGGFGGLELRDEKEVAQFTQELCDTFDKSNISELLWHPCIALYSTSPYGRVEGLEAPSGKRFTRRGYFLRHNPKHAKTPTEIERARLQRNVDFHTIRLEESILELSNLVELVDWETEPHV
jgi:hypothetical protein